jgi:hypothetical protein
MATQAVTSGASKNKGGTILHAGNADATVWTSKSLRDFAEDSGWSSGYGAKVIALTGTASTTGVQTAKGSGTLAYQPAPSDPQFLIRGYSTKINNVTSSILSFVSSDTSSRTAHRDRQKSYGAYGTEAIRDGGFSEFGIAGDRSNWFATASDKVTDDGTSVGGILTALNNTFKKTTDNTADSADAAVCNVRSSDGDLRGELVYMFGGKLPKQDNYKQKTG